ncbi:hypothetical protein [Conexibacter woesei]|uniref:hypothetical protein n=1 Tax=Conexibacter woesei TaxID=191495 RepID=UPI00047BDD42|nr:hypothetical protein [Conexibacter woesei]
MPFSLPEYSGAFAWFISDAIQELARAGDPILEQIEIVESPGALGSMFEDKEGFDVELEPASLTAGLVLDVDDVREGDPWKLALQIVMASSELREGQLRTMVGTLNRVTEATGNVVNAEGPLTFEALYEMLDKIEYGLTDDDTLSLPTMLVHPDTLAKMPVPTDEQQQQITDLQERKLNELLARRRRRRLS